MTTPLEAYLRPLMESLDAATFPPLLTDFLLTTTMSFLLGLGLREYYLASRKTQVFGSTRTCTFVGILGFVLYRLQESGWLYIAGLSVMGLLFSLYYHRRLRASQPGMIGILIALLSYAAGPITQTSPDWFLILFTITALFVLNAKEKIHLLTQKLADEELITLAKFLVLSGVILPLTPREPIAAFIPVSLHQAWLAVVVISGISYFGYILQTYRLRDNGMLLAGAIGGVYSSTATTVVTARRSHEYPPHSTEAAAAILLATGVMYLRLLGIVAIFNIPLCLSMVPAFVGLALSAGGIALFLHRLRTPVGKLSASAYARNPLELSFALSFTGLFVTLAAATRFVLNRYAHEGLQWMAFFAGFGDVDPFVLALLQGEYAAPQHLIGRAIIIATASNNVLKAIVAVTVAERYTGRLAGALLLMLAGATLAFGLFAY